MTKRSAIDAIRDARTAAPSDYVKYVNVFTKCGILSVSWWRDQAQKSTIIRTRYRREQI